MYNGNYRRTRNLFKFTQQNMLINYFRNHLTEKENSNSNKVKSENLFQESERSANCVGLSSRRDLGDMNRTAKCVFG